MELLTLTGDESTRIIKPGKDAGTISNPLACSVVIWFVLPLLAVQGIYMLGVSFIKYLGSFRLKGFDRYGIVV